MKRKPRNLTEYLTAQGVQQSTLARQLGISPQFLCDIRSGRRSPRLSLALAIAAKTGVPVESMVSRPSSSEAA